LTGIKRHDYLPFGEELGAGVGGRTTGQGYVADNVRQKFGGGKERDDETGLDYFGARYYSSTMGRFTSVDPIAMAVARLIDPQSINLYSYTRNNPLKFIDPTGQYFTYGKGAEDELKKYRAFLEKDPKKYKSQLDTLNKLDGSKVEYHLTLKNESKEGVEGHVSAELTEGGKSARVIINLSNVGGPQGEKFSPFARMAHELEHGRQFEDGEIGFAFLNGKYRGTVGSDASDEFKAFQAMLPLATDKDCMVMAGPRDFEFRILDAIRTASSQDEDARQGVVVRISQDYKDAAEKNAYGTNFNYGSSEKHGLISADKYVLFGIKHK
jgi:RHS repeat-associated protein